MQRLVQRSATTVIALTIIAACTSPTSDKPAAKPADRAAGSTVGITKDAVRVALVVADLSLLTKQNLAPDLGDPVKAAQAAVDEINASGGVAGGRKLVLTSHKILNAPIATAETLQRACVQATEEDKPLAVVIGAAVLVDVAQCVAGAHEQLAITMDSWQQRVYDDANGRLFSLATPLSVSIERDYAYWPTLLTQGGALDGKTIGIINQDRPANTTAAGTALKAALAKAHLAVAAEATVPYPEGSLTCSQPDVAIEKMKQAKVDFVFLLAQNLCGAAIVKAAAQGSFKPQWATIGNNVTDTVAQFYAPAKDNYDGAWGVGSVFPKATAAADKCAEIVERRAHLHLTRGSDAWGFAAVTCLQVKTLADALNAAKAPLTRESVVAAFEAMSSVPMAAGPPGSFSAKKHDAGDYVFLEKYSAAEGKFVPVDVTPRRVP